MVRNDTLNNLYPLSLLRLVLCTNMWSILENVPYVLENNVHFVCFLIQCLIDINSYYLAAKSCSDFCNPVDCSPPGSFVHEISQARILE